ncbi:hypothetical protein LMOh7858_1378 [Listeria monocytogenes str. 4b H7858]|nr:hypothetical protein LMOh7858_1378 [Listeria monocytogenes str. 4b H7858] [Listeria monocytogenes serotype 4b str. H7858]
MTESPIATVCVIIVFGVAAVLFLLSGTCVWFCPLALFASVSLESSFSLVALSSLSFLSSFFSSGVEVVV